MNIVLATGIYPPQIGGPATYCRQLADRLTKKGHEVVVVTYGAKTESGSADAKAMADKKWKVESVSRSIPLLRWFQYAKKLREIGSDADVVYAFSSISCGVPLMLSGLKKPKRVLRLGGDFFWERYTDFGGGKGLREWYVSQGFVGSLVRWFVSLLIRSFDHVVFSTDFQKCIYTDAYKKLPSHSVIENALELEMVVPMEHHVQQKPFRLLFLGRFVHFKQIPTLIEAVAQIPDALLTIVGDGPQDIMLRKIVERLGLDTRIRFVAPLTGKEKYEIFGKHDLLVLPSLTDISPNTALEARSVGLPVLLTDQNGLSESLRQGMVAADLSSVKKIVEEINRVKQGYEFIAEAASKKIDGRSWGVVAEDHTQLFLDILEKNS
ncbi:MAG: glycosyltransferase family 4 protein [bacterium]|nr:glycosyltransferase family 4 protein [bacterium]MDA1292953.1 glycosyltransferase family 4 protein [bacterium]